jgi:hypothetical protein
MYHYVKRFAARVQRFPASFKVGAKRAHRRKGWRPYKLWDNKCFRDGCRDFAERLAGRFLSISMGNPTPDIEPLYRAFKFINRSREEPHMREKTKHIIDAVDTHARELYERRKQEETPG